MRRTLDSPLVIAAKERRQRIEIVVVLGMLIALIVALAVKVSRASDSVLPPVAEGNSSVLDVDRGIRFILQASPCWGLAANGSGRSEMAEMIAEAADAAGVPPLLLTVLAKRESSFSVDAVGSRGEIGLLQVHGLAAKGCDLETPEGQLACGARWLRRSFDMCGGTWERAITAYAAGYCTAPKDSKLASLVSSRLRQWQRAQAAIDSCHDENSRHWVCKPPRGTCIEAVRIIARERDRPHRKGVRLSGLQNP